MGTILKGATVVELEPVTVEVTDLRVEGQHIAARGARLLPEDGDDVVDLTGRVVMPGLVSTHHNLYAALARGMPGSGAPPEQYLPYVEQLWWRLEGALDLDAAQAAAAYGALEALHSGTTTLFDQHSSPRAIRGSLTRVARGINEVGLRAGVSYEVTDRNGALAREESLEESVEFSRKARGRFRGVIGGGASFTLSPDTLAGLHQAVAATSAPLQLSLAEDPTDQRLSFERYGEVPIERLMRAELLGPHTIVAHVVHLAWEELSAVLNTGAWLSHNARANMDRQVGYAPALKFGARGSIGTAGFAPDVLEEVRLAFLRSRDAGQPIDLLHYLANGQRIASAVFQATIGPIQPGALADLVVLDYRPATPLTPENLASHFIYGVSSRNVESVMVDGLWRLWARRPLSVNPDQVAEHARAASSMVWSRLTSAQ